MNTLEDMAWAYSDSMREDETTKNEDMATAHANGFKAGAKAFTKYLKDLYERSGDIDFVFWRAEKVFKGADMFESDEE